MYWKIEALTAKRSLIIQPFEGSREDIKNHAAIYGLEIIHISPDYIGLMKGLLQGKRLASSELAIFFKDFADLQKCGLSIIESINTLNETSSNAALKEALRKISNFINDGRSLEESFENTKIFSKIVCVSLSAAEQTGNIPELLDLLAQYYKFKSENSKRIIKSLIYPAVILILLTGLSIFISIKLVPLLKTLTPSQAKQGVLSEIFLGYADFIKTHGMVLLLSLGCLGYAIRQLWQGYKEQFMQVVFKIPLLGELIKNMELVHVFLNLYVYLRSGINIIQTIENIHKVSNTYITQKLVLIGEKVFRGASLADAFKQDPFFPAFVSQNLNKGQASGLLPQYMERIYKYYDMKTRESIEAIVVMVEPALLAISALFLLGILCTFILPIYTNISQIGEGVFK